MEREHKPEGTRGFSRLEVFEKAATKKDNHNHLNSLQRVNYRIENIKMSRNMIKAQVQSGATAQETMQLSRAERLLHDSYAQKIMEQTLDFHWKRSMANHSRNAKSD